MKLVIIIAVVVVAAAGVIVFGRSGHTNSKPVLASPGAIRYLPLGDSYTIGQSVAEAERWPNQLVASLANSGPRLQIVANPSVTGYTTKNLIDRELPLVASLKPDFVTILIGVNDYVQGVDRETFTDNLNYIVDSLQHQLVNPKNIVLITIPDYGKTPTGARYGAPATSEAGIREFNAVIMQIGAARGLPVADIFSVSQGVVQDPTLTAGDGLHPSGKQYALWTAIIQKTITDAALLR
ncbi:MAG: SGNH/GDSL hydrolase family protein [Patescibacteria group bacterium]|nr:SGNH/GDSL hydrolase family protein [Patescibacteria group bacterium]